MKKICFVHYRKDYSNNSYYFTDTSLNSDFYELMGSFILFTKFEQVLMDYCDKDTTLIITIQSPDISFPQFLNTLKEKISKISYKKIFFDFSTYDHQEIAENTIDTILDLFPDSEKYVISKNLISKRENHLWFEVLLFHYVHPTNSVIPLSIDAFKKVEETTNRILRKFKGMFYAGHIRFHKVEFLEFLYQNDYLKDFIWSSTGPDYEPELFNEFIPYKFKNIYDKFEIVKKLPHITDYENYDDYRDRQNAYNFISYLDSYFDIVTETRFYHIEKSPGATNMQIGWNNISEKIMKPTLMSHPFILLSKPNTISILESMGLKYNYDIWKHDYDSIEDDMERMKAIKNFTHNIMKLSKKELREFKINYNNFTSKNLDCLAKDIYPQSIINIYNKI